MEALEAINGKLSTNTASDDLTVLKSSEKLRDAAYKFKNLIETTNKAFLLGAGCSKCAGLPLTSELTKSIINIVKGDTKAILLNVIKEFDGTSTATIEDYMSELIDLLSITTRRVSCAASNNKVKIGKTDYDADQIRGSLEDIKATIANAINKSNIDIKYHRDFVKTIHCVLQAGKLSNLDAISYFILNYDTLVEDSLALERIPYVDGFSGGVTGWWNPECFDEAVVRARVFKVHGSIDWCALENDILPRRIRPNVITSSALEKVLIWPATTKYKEAQRDPYAQIISKLRKVLRPAHNSGIV